MIKISGAFDFSRIRNYHPNFDLIALSRENRCEQIINVPKDIYIDLDSEKVYNEFLFNFEKLLRDNKLDDRTWLDLLCLLQETYGDIEILNEIT